MLVTRSKQKIYTDIAFFFFITSNLELKLVPQVFWILSLSNSYFLKKKTTKTQKLEVL